jgi:hypothetical protein
VSSPPIIINEVSNHRHRRRHLRRPSKPKTRHLLDEFHRDLQKAFEDGNSNCIRLTPRWFEVWWKDQKEDPYCPPMTGVIKVPTDGFDFEWLESRQERFRGVLIGDVFGYPLTAAPLYFPW